uniref:MIP18 family-like domain-containing protein n=1 Tax=Ficedula albicollis TaxID=59894 RepID=A0A803WAX3_FICAL
MEHDRAIEVYGEPALPLGGNPAGPEARSASWARLFCWGFQTSAVLLVGMPFTNPGEIPYCCALSRASDIIRTIRDPEKPNTLEELEVVTENCVEVQEIGEDEYLVIIRFTPTVPHCSLATLIGEIPLIRSETKSTRFIWASLDAFGPSSGSLLPGCVGLTRNCILRTQPPMQANQKPNQTEQKKKKPSSGEMGTLTKPNRAKKKKKTQIRGNGDTHLFVSLGNLLKENPSKLLGSGAELLLCILQVTSLMLLVDNLSALKLKKKNKITTFCLSPFPTKGIVKHGFSENAPQTLNFTGKSLLCSVFTGLCLRIKLQRCLPFRHKLEIYISEGTHSTEEDINKQINDKERVAAAMENPNLREIVEQCVTEPD